MPFTLSPVTAKSPVATARDPDTSCTFTGLPYANAGTSVRPYIVTAPGTSTNPTCATLPRGDCGRHALAVEMDVGQLRRPAHKVVMYGGHLDLLNRELREDRLQFGCRQY